MNTKRKIIIGGIAVAATLALTLGGSATAASQITSADIKNQTIQSWDIDRGGVASSEVRNQSLQSWDLDRGSVAASELRDGTIGAHELTDELRAQVEEGGPKGDQGEPGTDGTDGANGQDGVSGYEVIAVEQRLAVGSHEVVASCPDGKVAVGGGYELSADGANGANTSVQQSQTTGLTEQADGTWQGTSWTVRATIAESGGGDNMGNVKAIVNCARAN